MMIFQVFLHVILGRQGENISPFLFSIFLADLEDYLMQYQIKVLENINNLCQEELIIFVLIFVLLYADDTIILSESATDLQSSLDVFENYCSQ